MHMNANTFGSFFRVHSFGESHGPAMGVVIDGIPAGLKFDAEILINFLKRRRPAQSSVVSDRKEADHPEILSGIFENKTLGTPIAVVIRNTDAQSEAYKEILHNPRQGHADDLWLAKYGHSDPRGGGRSSGRETVSRVIQDLCANVIESTVSTNKRKGLGQTNWSLCYV